MDISTLTNLVQDSAALRSRTELTPAGGGGDKVFPPTYAEAKYAMEARRVAGEDVACVLLDSVQSQANRFEVALQEAIDLDRIAVPCIRVTFPPELAREFGEVTSLTAPHRCYDAILRDSDYGDTPFPKSDIGRLLSAARPADATALYRYCPTVLVFGGWDSAGSRGGMGAKFSRAVSSEIVGLGVSTGVRTSSRIDPLGIRREVGVLIEGDDRSAWSVAPAGGAKGKKPSEIVHGNIAPSIDADVGGVTVDSIEQTWVLSLPALRRYRFPMDGGHDEQRNAAGRAVLVALALAARALAHSDGLFLRSRCQLVPVPGGSCLEGVASDGSVRELEDPTVDDALELLAQAIAAAADHGLEWEARPVTLQAQERLVELVKRSLELSPKSAS